MKKITKASLSISPRLLYEEARSRKIKCTILTSDLILMEKKVISWYVMGSRTSLHSSVGRSIDVQKDVSKIIFEHFNIPTAKYVVVQNTQDISKVNELKFPIVMKPYDGHHGDGVIVGIKDFPEAMRFFIDAKVEQESKLLFEEMLEGKEFRILVINHKVVAAAYRKPAYVVGDGEKSIRELIAMKNKDPRRKKGYTAPMSKIVIDSLVKRNLLEQSLRLESIPAQGVEVQLRRTSNISTGGEATNVTHELCQENIELFEKISRVCDLNTVGIDVMCQTLQKPLVEQERAGIIEVNGSPGLRMHHFPVHGEPINVASKILDMVEEHYKDLL